MLKHYHFAAHTRLKIVLVYKPNMRLKFVLVYKRLEVIVYKPNGVLDNGVVGSFSLDSKVVDSPYITNIHILAGDHNTFLLRNCYYINILPHWEIT